MNDVLFDRLRSYVGRRVKIQSSIVRHDGWELLVDVTRTADGIVWAHGQDGTSWVVSEDGLEVKVEEVEGTHDMATGAWQMWAVDEARRRYEWVESTERPLDPYGVPDEVKERQIAEGLVEGAPPPVVGEGGMFDGF
jgi:hypothetical protein